MNSVFAKRALLPDGWRDSVRLSVEDGRIARIAVDAAPAPSDVTVDALLPALANLHSHTFQRAMAGMTEQRGAGPDSFWTWRDLMYRFLQHLTPDDVEAIAAFAFMEMQEAGFSAVSEFHYLHHAAGGVPYADRAELSVRIMAAARTSGIGLTLLPVLYSFAGLGKKPLAEAQLRFGNSRDDYLKLHGDTASALAKLMPPDCRIGAAPHSLRAVTPEDLSSLAAELRDMPFHMHIAEQTAEVDAVLAATRQTPVAWLLDHVGVGPDWCLIHATHMTPAETAALAATSAVAGLCPITEANLGDGIFNGVAFLEMGGRFGVGSDSNVNITVAGELALLEYSQRLRERRRNVLVHGSGSTGADLYRRAAAGGAQASGRRSGTIVAGAWADLMAIDGDHVQLCALSSDRLLDGWIFATNERLVTDVWCAGRHVVVEGRHRERASIESAYRRVMQRLAQEV